MCIRDRVYACLCVTCHLHFWQNHRDTGVERTPNKSQHTKLTLEKKILPPLLPGLELATFRSRVRRSNQQAIPAPGDYFLNKDQKSKTHKRLQIVKKTEELFNLTIQNKMLSLWSFCIKSVPFCTLPTRPDFVCAKRLSDSQWQRTWHSQTPPRVALFKPFCGRSFDEWRVFQSLQHGFIHMLF